MNAMAVGTGWSRQKESFQCGREVAEKCISSGNIKKPDLAIAFCTNYLDPDLFFDGMRSVLGPTAQIIGGSTIGIITNDHLAYNCTIAGAAVLQLNGIGLKIGIGKALDKDEVSAGEEFINALGVDAQDSFVLFFYDSVRIPSTPEAPPVLNTSTSILSGIFKGLRVDIPLVGAGLLGDYDFQSTRQFCGNYVSDQSIVGISMSRPIRLYFKIMHGCTPLDGIYHKITKLEGNVIYELDGIPITEIIDSLIGSQDWRKEHPVKDLTLGVNYGDKYSAPQEGSYVNRLLTGIMPDGKGMGLFEEDLCEGMEIQFMLRDSEKMVQSAIANSQELVSEVLRDKNKPLFALYIDCAGRTAEFSNTLTEEAAEIQKVMNRHNIPLLGFYSGVEIAPLLNKSRGLDWTGVLVIFAEGYVNEQ